jgi:hypothetical protein
MLTTILAMVGTGVASPLVLEVVRHVFAGRKAARDAADKAASDSRAATASRDAQEITARYAVRTAEIQMVPHLLERIESLEADRDACRDENAVLRGQIEALRDELAELRRHTLG